MRRGNLAQEVDEIRTVFSDAGVESTPVETLATLPSEGDPLRAVPEDLDAVIAVGGDGTVNTVLQWIARSSRPVALGVIPRGSGNLLARELGIVQRGGRAAATLLKAQRRSLPLGGIESLPASNPGKSDQKKRYWLAAAGAGVDADVLQSLAGRHKSRFGILAYYGGAVRRVLVSRRALQPFSVEWRRENGELRTQVVTQVLIERINYFGPCIEGPGATMLAEGQLRVVLFKSGRRTMYVNYGMRQLAYLWGQVVGSASEIEAVRVEQVTCFAPQQLEQDPPILAQADGEIVGSLPVRIFLSDKRVDVLVPAPTSR